MTSVIDTARPEIYCVGKSRFNTFSGAQEVAKRSRRVKGRVPYRCPHCNGFHIGNKFKTTKKGDFHED